MRALATRGEPLEAHDKTSKNAPDWESIRLFLEVIRHGSIRSAADHLSLSFSVLRRRIACLEQQLSAPLLTRHTDGVRLTAEGQKVFEAGCRMEAASFGLIRAVDATVPNIAGKVKIAVTEGTGTFWLAPRLVELQRAYPKLLVDLKCLMSPVDVSSLEADLAVQLVKPSTPELKIVRLGYLHTMPFAAHSYINTYGLPTTLEELKRHRGALHVADQTQAQALYNKHAADLPLLGTVALQTNVASAHLWAVAKGVGIGWLPTYTHFIGGPAVPIDVGPRFVFDIWLTYHPDAAKIARVRRVIDWVKDSFDAQKFPWFGEQFIHPYDLPKAYRGEPLVNMFGGFTHSRASQQAFSSI